MFATSRFYFQLFRVFLHVMQGVLTCWLIFPFITKLSQQGHIQRWSKKLLTIFNVNVNQSHLAIPSNAVVIANHVSWLDIFVINSVAPCRFVAKADIKSWPLLGWLAERAGTIYISRGSKSDLKRIYQYLLDRVAAGDRVAFFPEGTTAAQGKLKPFHPNLFESAIHANAVIQPIAVRYLDPNAQLHPTVDFIDDMTFATSINQILRGSPVTVDLHCLAPIPTDSKHRRELSIISRAAIAQALQVDLLEAD